MSERSRNKTRKKRARAAECAEIILPSLMAGDWWTVGELIGAWRDNSFFTSNVIRAFPLYGVYSQPEATVLTRMADAVALFKRVGITRASTLGVRYTFAIWLERHHSQGRITDEDLFPLIEIRRAYFMSGHPGGMAAFNLESPSRVPVLLEMARSEKHHVKIGR